MSAEQVIFQFLSQGSNTLIKPTGFSNQVLVYAWGAGGGGGAGGGDTYQRTATTRSAPVGPFTGGTSLAGAIILGTVPLGRLSTRTETITVSPGVIPPAGPTGIPGNGQTTYSAWTKISSGSSDGRALGGGGGFVQGIVTVNSGDTMVIAVGGRGEVGINGSRGIGGVNPNPVLPFDGGTTGSAQSGAGGGGGAATVIFVNNVPMIVAAGGGGGSGGRDESGFAGGIATLTAATQRGGSSTDGGQVGGGGGAGYPLGGAGGLSVDANDQSTGGYGGQNYANATVTSSTLTAGSGITPGDVTNALYPKANRGYAGYDGAVIVIFTKSFRGFIKDTTWKNITNAFVKIPNSLTTLYRTIAPRTDTYTSGTHTFTIPPGVFSLDISATGGGGGGGGTDSQSGAVGRSGAVLSGTLSVSPGQVLTLHVGMGGGGGVNDQGSAPGGAGGSNGIGYRGGNGSAAGPTPISGGGGGGGAGTALLVGSTLYAVAGGGGGGGGGGNGSGGQGVNPGGTAGSIAGGNGQAKGGDGGGAGGGGGGHPLGGAGGIVAGGDNGGFSGADGGSLVPSGWTQSSAANGGTNGVRGVRSSSRGGTGRVTIAYSSAPIAEVVETGGWKKIAQSYIKEDNQWKSIQSDLSLVPVPSSSETVTVNITIAADTNNYVLSEFLSGTSYNPGRSIVNLTVDPGVIVGSTSAGEPALIIDGLVSGDLINLINNGNIAGAGGRGGAAGSYTSVTSGGSSPVKGGSPAPKGGYSAGTTTVTSVPGRPGEIGGPALYVTYTTNLINNGTIAGGGGGGGGGGGSTGGQGGGGAGRIVGVGANNGTLTAGGAGTGLGGAGGARGTAGSAGTNDTNAGGVGGAPGAAILGIDKVTITTAGIIIGERKVIAREVG